MSFQQQEQQRLEQQERHEQLEHDQRQLAASKTKKKKYATRKLNEDEEPRRIARKSNSGGGGGGGGGEGDAAIAVAVAYRQLVANDKKPLHTSMEHLQMQQTAATPTHQQQQAAKVNASRRDAGSNWNSRRQSNITANPKANVENKAPIIAPVKATVAPLPGPMASSATPQLHQHEPATVKDVDENSNAASTESSPCSKSARMRQKRKAAQRNKYLAMDCEMVGVGFNGQYDMLARVSIVNKQGDVLLDKFVKPRETVTDYRTSVSGIRPHDIDQAEDFNVVQDEVVKLLQGKVLIGHGIRNDLAVLHIKHPFINIRDTSRYKPLCHLVSNGRTPSLKRLSKEILGLEIQSGEHNSVEDARAAMSIYNCLREDWEKYIQKHHRK